MQEYLLRLYDDWNSSLVQLRLHPLQEKQPLSALMEVPKAKVYFNREYNAQLMSPGISEVRSLEVQLNGYVINTNYSVHSGRIQFYDSFFGARIFSDCYGLSSFTLKFRTPDGWKTLVSEPFQVMVKPDNEILNVSSIGSYTALHNRSLLFGTRNDFVTRMPDAIDQSQSLEDKVRLLKKTAALLEKDLRVLRVSPRTKTTVSSGKSAPGQPGMITSLLRHPQSLARVPRGIGISAAGGNFMIDSSKYSVTACTTDIYENQVILAFIKAIRDDICTLLPALKAAAKVLPVTMESNGEFISSSSFMNDATRTAMNNLADDLSSLQEVYGQLYDLYVHVIPAREIALSSVPKPTPAFLSLAAYRPIFEAVVSWFSMRSVGVRDLRFVQVFQQITTLYEVYVLVKLQQFLESERFELVSAYRQVYEFEGESLYQNTTINNVFVYERNDVRLSLFYQPVLYDHRHEQNSPVGLYRNTSLSFPKNWNESSRGSYYTPDYIIRMEHIPSGKAQYVLADAKYANFRNVREFKTIPLIYKYLFSLTPENAQDSISGLYIFHGKASALNQGSPLLHSIYDLADTPHDVFPQVEIISLYQYAGTLESDQFTAFRTLLEKQLEHLLDQKQQTAASQNLRALPAA